MSETKSSEKRLTEKVLTTDEFIKKIADVGPSLMFKMRLRFKLSISVTELDQLLRMFPDGMNATPVAKDCILARMDMTVPFIPDDIVIAKYIDIIKETYTAGGRLTVRDCVFDGFEYLRPVDIIMEE